MSSTSSQLYLFKSKRFLPLFIIQFCGCLNDNILKNALIILITYKLAADFLHWSPILVLLANAIFISPFILFASLSGQVADKYERSLIVKIIKFIEIIIVLVSFYGFFNNNLYVIFCCICVLGIHSAFFGPIKYSALPDHLDKTELLSANGFVEAGTFLSILIGTIIGGYYTIFPQLVILIALITSTVGFIYSFFIPKSKNTNTKITINFNIIQETMRIVKYARSKKQVYLSILGISWFWFFGAAILAQIPSLTKDVLGGDENVANLFLAIFSVGVGVGSFLCSQILKNAITTKYTALCALILSVLGIDLALASRISDLHYQPSELSGVVVFLSKLHNWRIVVDLFCLSAVAGLYVVPLFATMQYFAGAAHRSRIVAANNLINSVFMVGSTIILSFLFYIGFAVPTVILLVSVANIIVAIRIYQIMPNMEFVPHKLLKLILRAIFDACYQVEVKGIVNLHKAGKRVVIISNHLSYIDPALIAVYLPDKITFAINTSISKLWWVRPFLKIVKAFPVDPTSPMAIKGLINLVKANQKVAIFPEGRISTTGSLMKIYEGPGVIAHKADASILPIRIDGTQYTHFSKVKNMFRSRLFPKITITILPPVKLLNQGQVNNKLWRKTIATRLYDIMAQMLFESSDHKQDLVQALIESAKIHGMSKSIIHEIDGSELSYRVLLQKAFLLRSIIVKIENRSQYIGLMLPQSAISYIVFYGVLSAGKPCAMIDYTRCAKDIISCCKLAEISVIFSSREFINKAKLAEAVKQILQNNIQVIFIEDIMADAKLVSKIKFLLLSLTPEFYYNYTIHPTASTNPAVILFNFDQDANPKAIVLSHRNINANRYQIISKIDFMPHDIACNAMYMHEHIGLFSGILMLLCGIKSFLYNDPLRYRVISELIYDIGATILFSTNTGLKHHLQQAHPYDFYSLRYVFECNDFYDYPNITPGSNIADTMLRAWLNKFGIRVFEVYSKPEGSFIIAANTPMHNKSNTIGRLMPKIEYFIEKIDGVERGGILHIKGPNIMLGVIEQNNPGQIRAVRSSRLGEGWYNTKDIVEIDEEGYITYYKN
jgi:acyl-[acyl-carrier-protein]-phospholipid O-acyltransferase / long-chain-fatty-acid--[acyl-carrier-protein] ligase